MLPVDHQQAFRMAEDSEMDCLLEYPAMIQLANGDLIFLFSLHLLKIAA